MKVLVTGSAGHLGEALCMVLKEKGYEVTGLDMLASTYTSIVGSVDDPLMVKEAVQGVSTIFHTATLHKPHVATHTHQQFIDTNISGTLNLLREGLAAGIQSFIFTSTTSVFGDALVPPADQPAAWITEDVTPVPKNIYGVTKAAAEDLCQLYFRNHGLPVIVLKTSRFFPEEDDHREVRNAYHDSNLKVNEYLFRRVDIDDVVSAHLDAMREARNIGFGKYIISATTPFSINDLKELRTDAPSVVKRLYPQYEDIFRQLGWRMFPSVDRVYVNEAARKALQWKPVHDFASLLEKLKTTNDIISPLAKRVGSKGYHTEKFEDGPYPVAPVK